METAIETITVTTEATLFDEVIFEEEKEYPFEDDEYAFEGIRCEIIDRIEAETGWEYEVEDRLVDGFEVKIIIRDEDGDQVGEGYIRA